MVGRLLIALVRVYQVCISSWMPPVCRYTPSCSAYMIEAIRTHGVWRGVALGCWRILRCHPWARGGHDPVPGTESRDETDPHPDHDYCTQESSEEPENRNTP